MPETKILNRAALMSALRNVPGDTPISVVAYGDPSVGIPEARYGIYSYSGDLLTLSVDGTWTVSQLYDVLAIQTAKDRLTGDSAAEYMLAYDPELGSIDDTACEIIYAVYVPECAYSDDPDDVDSAYFEIVLQD